MLVKKYKQNIFFKGTLHFPLPPHRLVHHLAVIITITSYRNWLHLKPAELQLQCHLPCAFTSSGLKSSSSAYGPLEDCPRQPSCPSLLKCVAVDGSQSSSSWEDFWWQRHFLNIEAKCALWSQSESSCSPSSTCPLLWTSSAVPFLNLPSSGVADTSSCAFNRQFADH